MVGPWGIKQKDKLQVNQVRVKVIIHLQQIVKGTVGVTVKMMGVT